jgi:hypothetical protein
MHKTSSLFFLHHFSYVWARSIKFNYHSPLSSLLLSHNQVWNEQENDFNSARFLIALLSACSLSWTASRDECVLTWGQRNFKFRSLKTFFHTINHWAFCRNARMWEHTQDTHRALVIKCIRFFDSGRFHYLYTWGCAWQLSLVPLQK